MITDLIQILMTPNEVFIKVILSFSSIIESFLYLKFFTQILNISSTKIQNCIYIISSVVTFVVCNFILKSPISDLLNVVAFILLLIFLFKQSIKNGIIGLITTYITVFVSAFLSEIILGGLLKINITHILDIPFYRILSCTLTYINFGLLYLVIAKRKVIIKMLKLSLKSTTIISLILGIIVIFIQSYIFSTYENNLSFEMKLTTIISLSLYFFVSMYSLIRTKKLEQTTQDLETEKLYNKTLTLLHDNIRCFKHDFDNIVQSLGGYIALNDIDGLREYYNNLLQDCRQTNDLNILNPETINNPSIYSLLTNKYYLASQKGIKMTFEIFTDLSKINFNIYQFTRILGILLDNAIEAAQETDEKIINIEFRSDAKKQLFIIANSCKDNNISTTKIFEKGYSTKTDNSGIGLWKVHNILSKNTNIDLFTTVHNNIFTQQLEVFY
ncbi:MAG: GHKL domain-containing protein [Clostridia bacterium]|nr:GHKL domain-containing protein [Clostridia bacterium]